MIFWIFFYFSHSLHFSQKLGIKLLESIWTSNCPRWWLCMLAAKSLTLLVVESIRGFVHLSVSPSTGLLVYQYIHCDLVKSGKSILSLSLTICLSVCPSLCLSVCLSVCHQVSGQSFASIITKFGQNMYLPLRRKPINFEMSMLHRRVKKK